MMNKKYQRFFSRKKVLITGNTGFKGSWLTFIMIIMGAKVIGLSDCVPTKPSLYEILKLKKYIKQYFVDICDFNSLKKIIKNEKPDVIFHLAAQSLVSKSFKDPIQTIKTNTLGTATLLEVAKSISHNIKLVLITSDKAYQNNEWIWGYRENDKLGGIDLYSASKSSAENIIYAYYNSFFKNKKNISLAVARAGNVIGGGDWSDDRIVVDLFKSWKNNTTLYIRSPESTRPWQHVLEPLSGYIKLAMELKSNSIINGEAFNFGPNQYQNNNTVKNLVDSISSELKKSGKKLKIRFKKNNQLLESKLLSLNCEKAYNLLNWQSKLNYSQTINLVSSWYFNYFYNKKEIIKITKNQIINYF